MCFGYRGHMSDSYHMRYVVDNDYDSPRWRRFSYGFSTGYGPLADVYPDYYYTAWGYTCINLGAVIAAQVPRLRTGV